MTDIYAHSFWVLKWLWCKPFPFFPTGLSQEMLLMCCNTVNQNPHPVEFSLQIFTSLHINREKKKKNNNNTHIYICNIIIRVCHGDQHLHTEDLILWMVLSQLDRGQGSFMRNFSHPVQQDQVLLWCGGNGKTGMMDEEKLFSTVGIYIKSYSHWWAYV